MKRTNELLWKNVKTIVLKNDVGGAPGKWSARKAQISVKLYKKMGGKYIGSKSPNNKLTKWSREKWESELYRTFNKLYTFLYFSKIINFKNDLIIKLNN